VLGPGAGVGGGGLTGGGGVPRGGRVGGGGARSYPGAKVKQQHDQDRFLNWETWWEVNDDRFQRIRSLLRTATGQSGESDAVLGAGSKGLVAKVTQTDVGKEILPAVRRVAKDPSVAVRRQAAIALGKIADASQTDVFQTIRSLAGDPDWEVRSAGALALGLQGSSEGVPLLVQIMKDDRAARQFFGIGEHEITPRERGFAALGIGVVGIETGLDAQPVQELVTAVREKSGHPDIRVFPSLALGVMHAYAAVPELKKVAFDPAAPEVVRAHAIVALAKLGDKSSVTLFSREGLVDRSAHVQRSSAIALGLLTDKDDQRTVEILVDQSKSSADRAVRNFTLIALGQIGNRLGIEGLLAQLKRGTQHDRTFAALGLGIHAFNVTDARKEVGANLLAAFSDARSETEKGAFAIALGLADYKPAIEPIRQALANEASPELKANFATAIGLLGDRAAIPVLQQIIQTTADPGLLMKAAIALGSIGDPSAVQVLVKVFERAGNNQPALLGATLALGFIGDRSAVAPLVKALESRTQEYTRAYAAMALGVLGDKREERALSIVQANTNYLATTEWLGELLSLY
jgi:HEAT repeat protein